MNRFGLETENAGKIRFNFNMCFQSRAARKVNRHKASLKREEEIAEMKRQLVQYRIEIKEKLQRKKKKSMLDNRKQRASAAASERSRAQSATQSYRRDSSLDSDDGEDFNYNYDKYGG